jgi:adenosylcobinamide kinase / adenosylcobinamide-phosphate guanylyltransferase
MRTLILGGQRSGKSRCAESRAADWLRAGPDRRATLLATAQGGDDEMRERIRRHRLDRAERVPRLATRELQGPLAQALRDLSAPDHLLVVDCLTLWLTQLLMPLHGQPLDAQALLLEQDGLCAALRQLPGPVVLVSNEIGFGVSPLSREARGFVDALGHLHQAVAAACDNLSLMVAGVELPVKRGAP